MVDTDIIQYINKGPGQNVDIKKDLPAREMDKREFAKLMVSFANTNDGMIILGADEETRTVVGIGQQRDYQREVMQIDENYCSPPVAPEVTFGDINNQKIVIINIKRGNNRPYYADGDCYVRKGREVYVASHSEMQEMYQKKSSFKAERNDKWPVEGATYEDLDAKKIKDYLNKVKDKFGESVYGSEEKYLRDMGVLTEVSGRLVPTAGGILMFGKNPQRFLISSGVRLARFQGKDTGSVIIDQKEVRGVIPEMIEKAGQFIIKHIGVASTIEGMKRDDIAEYPIVAVREAITNAIAHRDYTIDSSQVRIFIFDDRIEIYTPGGLPNGVTVENMMYTQYSRNRVLTEILVSTGQYMEKLGTGIRRIKIAVKQNGLREPRFFDTGTDFILTLYGPVDKVSQFKTHTRVIRAQQVLGPTKSPQEITRLPDDLKSSGRFVTKEHKHSQSRRYRPEKARARKMFLRVAAAGLILFIVFFMSFLQRARNNDPQLQYQKAALFHSQKEYFRAIEAYSKFIKRFPSNEKTNDAQYYMAACLEILGRDVEALNAYDELLKAYPRSNWAAYAQYWKGEIYRKLDQFNNSLEEYEKVEKNYPEHPLALTALQKIADCYYQQGKFNEAITAYENLLYKKEFFSDGFEYYQTGLCYLELKQPDKAKIMFQKVLTNDKAKPDIIDKAKAKLEELSM